MNHSKLRFAWTAAVGAILLLCASMRSVGFAQDATSKTEEIEWTWEVRPAHADAKLPNVLLLGDSITRAYFPEVQRQLDGVANVYLMASSTSVGDPRLAGPTPRRSIGMRFLHSLRRFARLRPRPR